MVETPYVHYELVDGYVHNWLVLGPWAIQGGPAGDPHGSAPGDGVDLAATAVEPASATDALVVIDGCERQWQAYGCLEDHLVEFSRVIDPGSSLRAWACIDLESPRDQSVVVTLSSAGRGDVWVEGVHVLRQNDVEDCFHSSRFEVALAAGQNRILVRLDAVEDAGATRLAMALRVEPESARARVRVCMPTKIQPLDRRNRLEAVLGCAQMKQYVVARKELVQFTWPETALFPEIGASEEVLPACVRVSEVEELVRGDASPTEDATPDTADASSNSKGRTSFMIRVQTPTGRIYGESEREARAGAQMHMGCGYRYPDGPLEAVLMPRAREYYEGSMRVSRTLCFWGLDNNPFSDEPVGTYAERRREALLAAARREAGLYSEIAKMAVSWWSTVELPVIMGTVGRLGTPAGDVYPDLVGLLGMVARYGDAEEFPTDLRGSLTDVLAGIVFWPELPGGLQSAGPESACFLSSVGEILAGQLCPDLVFLQTGQSGAWHRRRGEAAAVDWMRTRAMKGFAAWGSDVVYEETLLALAHLVDLADDDDVWNLSTVLLDKMLFLLAANSYKGIYGPAKQSTSTAAVLGGYFDATLGITKLMWGMGIFNPHIRAVVSLAAIDEYELPAMLQKIAGDLPADGLWGHEKHTPDDTEAGSNLVTFKTPDFMLSAVQDYHRGQPGFREHVWQATLGAGATVFVNHPVCASLDDAVSPNFWRGNGVLPRAAQWRDALIALYRLPEDDWMGITHAYFPVHAFDTYELRDGWAFAKKGNGYLALRSAAEMSFTVAGPAAERELRSRGSNNVWLCQMGRTAFDGDFAAFQERVLALPVLFTDQGVRWTTLRGDDLAFDWDGPLLVNGEPVVLQGDGHIEHPYCVTEFPAPVMDVRYGDVAMRLTFDETEL